MKFVSLFYFGPKRSHGQDHYLYVYLDMLLHMAYKLRLAMHTYLFFNEGFKFYIRAFLSWVSVVKPKPTNWILLAIKENIDNTSNQPKFEVITKLRSPNELICRNFNIGSSLPTNGLWNKAFISGREHADIIRYLNTDIERNHIHGTLRAVQKWRKHSAMIIIFLIQFSRVHVLKKSGTTGLYLRTYIIETE